VPSFRTGTVTELLSERAGFQRVAVTIDGGAARAYVITQLTGTVAVGDEVVLNTTAVELGLGTGGWHVVHWNRSRRDYVARGPGHIMKLRYTGAQLDAGSAEEHHPELESVESIDGMPVVVAALHSQLPAIAVAIRHLAPAARIAYVMTDGAALPIVFSDLVAAARERGLLDATITAGHAFGGDYEAVNVFSALAVARHVAHADITIVVMGPGIVGTNTRLGYTGIEVGGILDAAGALGGVAVAALRISFADGRPRHQGVSHHSLTALRLGASRRAVVAVPTLPPAQAERVQGDLAATNIAAHHDLIEVESPAVLELLTTSGFAVSSMGRPAAADPALFLAAGAAGALAVARAAVRWA
jgi:hypothetical protein